MLLHGEKQEGWQGSAHWAPTPRVLSQGPLKVGCDLLQHVQAEHWVHSSPRATPALAGFFSEGRAQELRLTQTINTIH